MNVRSFVHHGIRQAAQERSSKLASENRLLGQMLEDLRQARDAALRDRDEWLRRCRDAERRDAARRVELEQARAGMNE